MVRAELGQKLARGWLLIALVFIAMKAIVTVAALGNGLSPNADAWTEADIVRSAEGYVRLGFSSNRGLPDLSFGNQFADEGTQAALREDPARLEAWSKGALSRRSANETATSQRFVYTHYPPGPHWLGGVATWIWGTGRVNRYRALPISLTLLALVELAWALTRVVGDACAALVLTCIAALPMLVNAMHSLAYQGYALALLILELGVALLLRGGRPRTALYVIALFLLGFLQGWLGFDYLFLIALCPLAVWLVVGGDAAGWQAPARAGLAAACGFALAHLLHFAEVALFFGSASTAFEDMASVAQYRSFGTTSDVGVQLPSMPVVLWRYLTRYTASPTEFGIPVALIFVLALALVAGVHRWRTGQWRGCAPRVAGLCVALLASSGWVIVMPQHSAQHWHILPRHYFLTVVVALLAVVSELTAALRLVQSRSVSAVARPAPTASSGLHTGSRRAPAGEPAVGLSAGDEQSLGGFE